MMNLKKTIDHLKAELLGKDKRIVHKILNKFRNETAVEKACSNYSLHEKIIIISKLIDHFQYQYGYVPDWLYSHLVKLNHANNKKVINSFYN